MRLVLILFVCTSLAYGQGIETKVLTAGAPIKINLSPALTTTLLFPSALSGTFGLGWSVATIHKVPAMVEASR